MHDFMQSLQMRWPVPGHIGLSMMTSASAPTASPALRSMCISEIFSSSGQPVELDAERVDGDPDRLLRRALRRVVQPLRAGILVALVAQHAVVDLAQDFAPLQRASVSLKPSRRRRRRVGAEHRFGQLRARALDLDEMPVVDVLGKPEDDPACDRRDRAGAPRTSVSASRSDAATVCPSPALLAIQQRAAGARDRQLEVAAAGSR